MAQVTLNPTFGGRLLDSQANNNLTDTVGFGEENGSTNTQRGFIKFDLAGDIPAGATITGVTLRLYAYFDAADNNRTARVYRCLRAMTSGATWNTYDGSNNWGTAGAGNTTTDREATDVGTRAYTSNEAVDEYKEFTLDANEIQEMFTGAFTNNGFIIKMDTESDDCWFHRPPGHADEPELIVTYTPADSGGNPMVFSGGGLTVG